MRTYSDLLGLESFNERLDYLMLEDYHYDSPRDESDRFYKTLLWKQVRRDIIRRDEGMDLGVEDTGDTLLVHHINPITLHDLETLSPSLIDPENLITTTVTTHNTIHYGHKDKFEVVERRPGDTKLW